MTQSAHDPASGAETPEELSTLHNARPATLADLSATDQARPVRRSVRPGQGIHGQSSELPPDMRQISASASVRPVPDTPARSYPVIGGGESLSSADAGIPGPVQPAPAGYSALPGGAFGGDVPGGAASGHVPGGASFSSGGSSFGGAGTFGGAAPATSGFGGSAPGGAQDPGGASAFGGSAPGGFGGPPPGGAAGFGSAGSPGSDQSGTPLGGTGAPAPLPPAQPPLPKPDESPTMILPIIGAVKPLTVRRVLAGAVGVIALIVAGLLVLNVMIPEEKDARKPTPAQPVAQTLPPAPSPTPTAVRHKPVTELCTKLDTAPVKGLYPTVGAGAPTGLTCTASLEFKPPAGTPPKPPQHRSGSLAGTATYFPSGAEAVTAYGAKLTEPSTTLLTTVGSQAGMVTVPAGKTVTVTVHVLDDNVLLSFVLVANREDKDWTAPEIEQLRGLATQVATGTLAKL
ncbi:hypothetical protein [Longispora urticae]